MQLDDIAGQSLACLTGNGTTAISISLMALGINRGRVGIPSSACVSIALAVYASGNVPVFLDVDSLDMGISEVRLRDAVSELDAVVAVHNYGFPCNIGAIVGLCRSVGIPIVEDVCLFYSGDVNGVRAGSFGDVSVVSFGAGKILDLGRGGAIFCDDQAVKAKIRQFSRAVNPATPVSLSRLGHLSKCHTAIYNRGFLETFNPQALKDFGKVLKLAAKEFLLGADTELAEDLRYNLAGLNQAVDLRRNRHSQLTNEIRTRLSSSEIAVHPAPNGSIPWRLNLLTGDQLALFSRLKARGLPVSTWHPPSEVFFGEMSGSPQQTESMDSTTYASPVASAWGRTVVNVSLNGLEAEFAVMRAALLKALVR